MNNERKEAFLMHVRELLENPDPEVKNIMREAVTRAGYSQPDTQWPRVVKNYRDEIVDLTKDILSESGPEAAMTLVGVMRGSHGDNGAARDKLAAALNILDRGVGIVKVEKVEIEQKPGLVALPPKEASKEVPVYAEEEVQ